MKFTIEPVQALGRAPRDSESRDGTNFALLARKRHARRAVLFDEPRGPEVQRLDLHEPAEHV